MKAILITGYSYNESVKLVDVKETDKSYMAGGLRFRKGSGSNGTIGFISSTKYDGAKRLYPIDDEYAMKKLKEKKDAENKALACELVRKASAEKINEILEILK